MAVFYGYKKLERAEDWEGLAGEEKWRASRSAYELAFAWHGAGGLPEPIAAALASSGDTRLSGLALRDWPSRKTGASQYHGESLNRAAGLGYS